MSRTITVVLGVLLAINVALNVRQQRALERVQLEVRRAHEQLAARRFIQGDLLDHFEVIDALGATRTLSARTRGRCTIVVVDPACDSCVRTARELRAAAPSGTVWVISIAGREATTRFVAEHQLRDVYTLSPRNFPIVRQKFSAIPQTVRVERGLVTRTCDSVAACL